jgi:hypothetical protein
LFAGLRGASQSSKHKGFMFSFTKIAVYATPTAMFLQGHMAHLLSGLRLYWKQDASVLRYFFHTAPATKHADFGGKFGPLKFPARTS